MTNRCPNCAAPIPSDGPEGLCPKCMLAVGMQELDSHDTGGHDTPPPPKPSELQALFPHLEIVRLVGKGGMGAVYEARQRGLGRTVALKVLWAPDHPDAAFGERFAREGQALAQLSHDHIVTVHDAGKSGPYYWILMEYVDGSNLRQLLELGPMDTDRALPIVSQVCAALEYAHQRGVVHRDIKPENVMVTRDGRVKVADFGLAKILARDRGRVALTQSFLSLGTPHYMAPEQIERPRAVDHRADIYSLGVVLYEVLTGELPIGKFQLPSRLVNVSPRIDEIVAKAMQKEPARRYQAISEVQRAVDFVGAAPAIGQGSPRRYGRRRQAAWPKSLAAGIAFALISLIGYGIYSSQSQGAEPTMTVAELFARGQSRVRLSNTMQAGIADLESAYSLDPLFPGLKELLGTSLVTYAEKLHQGQQYRDALKLSMRAHEVSPSPATTTLVDKVTQGAQKALAQDVRITEPSGARIVTATAVEIRGTIAPLFEGHIFIRGERVYPVMGEFKHTVSELREGVNSVQITITDPDDGFALSLPFDLTLDTSPPELIVDSPTGGEVVPGTFAIEGTVKDGTSVTIRVGEAVVKPDQDGRWSIELNDADEGKRTLEVAAVDSVGKSTRVNREVIVDTTPPAVDVDGQGTEIVTRNAGENVILKVTDAHPRAALIGKQALPMDRTGSVSVYLEAGAKDGDLRTTDVLVLDQAMNTTPITFVVRRDTSPPNLDLRPDVVDLFPGSGFSLTGSIDDDSTCEIIVDGERMAVEDQIVASQALTVPIGWPAGREYSVALVARDIAGNEARPVIDFPVHQPCNECNVIDGVRGLCTPCKGEGTKERTCRGKGCKRGLVSTTCADCSGRGRLKCENCDKDGRLPMASCGACNGGHIRCPKCEGQQSIVEDCRRCGGRGEVNILLVGWRTCSECKKVNRNRMRYTCSRCTGSGTIECGECTDGNVKPKCLECRGGYLDAGCESCGSTGKTQEECSACSAEGRVARDCSVCGGSGECRTCYGTGHADPSLVAVRRRALVETRTATAHAIGSPAAGLATGSKQGKPVTASSDAVVSENPGNLTKYRGRNGESFLFRVVGDSAGSVYGTDLYTDDSSLAAVAVHSGLLKPGQEGVLRVTIAPGANGYKGTKRNGVSSASWGGYEGSYSVSAHTAAATTSTPKPSRDRKAATKVSPTATVYSGKWSIDGEELVGWDDDQGQNTAAMAFGDEQWTNYNVALQVRAETLPGGENLKPRGPSIRVHVQGQGDWCQVGLGRAYPGVTRRVDGKWASISGSSGQLEFDRWYELRVEVRGRSVQCFLDGDAFAAFEADPFGRGQIGVQCQNSRVRVKGIVVTDPDGDVLFDRLPVIR